MFLTFPNIYVFIYVVSTFICRQKNQAFYSQINTATSGSGKRVHGLLPEELKLKLKLLATTVLLHKQVF